MLEQYRTILSQARPGSALWLAPTSRAAIEARSRLLGGSYRNGTEPDRSDTESVPRGGGELDGCLAPGVTTFARFAETVLQRSPQLVRPLRSLHKRQLIRQLVDEAGGEGRLKHFGPIASTGGLLDLVCDFIRQLKRLEIWPEQFAEACNQRGATDKDRELLGIYAAYQKLLVDHNLYDAEGCFWSARDLLRRQPTAYRFIVAYGFSDFTRTEHDILQELAAHAEELWISLPGEGQEAGSRGERGKGSGGEGEKNALTPGPSPEYGRGEKLQSQSSFVPHLSSLISVPSSLIPHPFPDRADLFQKPTKTLDELGRRHANLRVEMIAPAAKPDWPAMAHVERMVFSNPRTMTDAPDTAGLEILAGGRQIGEIELIGRRIKRLLIEGDGPSPRPCVDGARPLPITGEGTNCNAARQEEKRSPSRQEGPTVRPGEIAVVFRRLQDVADLVGEVFQRMEIPFYLESGRSLSRCPPIVMLLRMLELDGDDWPMYRLLGVLGNNYFAPDWGPWDDRAASLAERTIRGLQIPRGRERLLEALAGSREQGAGSKEQGAGGDSYRIVNELLRGLADAFDRLPRSGTLAAHALAWMQLADRSGILRSMGGDADEAAWKQLHQTLREEEQLAKWLGRDARQLDRQQAREALVDILNHQTVGRPNEESGRVRVLSAASARHLRIPYLFLAGLSEKSFPAADSDARLYSEAEHRHLIAAGLPLPSRSDRQTDEMLLFYETITAATRRLYLSYPGIDDQGEPLTPSTYLQEVEQACGGTMIARFEELDLSPVPGPGDLCSPEAFRIRAVADALDGNPEPLAGFVRYCSPPATDVANPKRERGNDASLTRKRGGDAAPSLALQASIDTNPAESLLRGLEFSLARHSRERFGAAEGMLGPAAAELLQADFPPDRIYSATELENYAYCPYQFFLDKVLNVQPLEEVELEVDYRRRGQMAHEVLAAFHRKVNQAGGGPQSPVALAPEEYQRLLLEAIDEAIAQTLAAPGRDGLADALHELDRRKLLEWLEGYRVQHEKYDAQWEDCDGSPRPALFETSFGRPLREGDGEHSTEEPLELPSHGQVVRLAGRIDRIDEGQDRGHAIFTILDYKTGKGTGFKLEDCQRGLVLQLPLYALAVAELILKDTAAVPWQAGYWYLSESGFRPKQALRGYERVEDRLAPSEMWNEIRGILADTVAGLVRSMREGQFPVWSDDDKCTSTCPYSTVCRINQIRSLGKTWRPPTR